MVFTTSEDPLNLDQLKQKLKDFRAETHPLQTPAEIIMFGVQKITMFGHFKMNGGPIDSNYINLKIILWSSIQKV